MPVATCAERLLRYFAAATEFLGERVPFDRASALGYELLAVSDTAYLMLAGSRVVIAPYAVVTRSSFAYVGAVTKSLGETPSGKRQRQAVLYSRFPYGVPESALSALLRKSGQSAPDNARTAR